MSRKSQRNRDPRSRNIRRTTSSKRSSSFPFVVVGSAVVVIGVAILIGVLMLGGNDDNGNPAAATPDPSGFGPAPVFEGNITSVEPAHGETVNQASTVTTDPRDPKGVCANVTFEETTGIWYRMAINGEEVTERTTWYLGATAAGETPETGTICYVPEEGLPVGRVDAAVSVQDPQSFDSPPRETVGWKFEVTE